MKLELARQYLLIESLIHGHNDSAQVKLRELRELTLPTELLPYPITSRSDAMKLGSKFYYTGNVCKNGHKDLRYVLGGACRKCRGVADMRYNLDNGR